jgi:glycine dehydrogenase subunit 1
MLDAIGVAQLDDLVASVPAELRARAQLRLEAGRSEAEVAAEASALAELNRGARGFASFLGGGFYRHYVPAAVSAVLSRAEFATAYTPYQPEASQGTTQAIFEFQTLIALLTGLDLANASMYDGASAVAEAVLMARRVTGKRRLVALARSLWPDYRETVQTYLSAFGDLETVEIPYDDTTGLLRLDRLESLPGKELLCAVAGYPNGFGTIEPLGKIAEIVHRHDALLVSATAEALALALLKPPGELGADIAVGEGQSFGLGLNFGGPGLGFMACRSEHVRQMPGRLVGQTRDRQGRQAFCLTLAAREQHIRRERATSNICTNHSLCALAATVYLSLLGKHGLRELAERNVQLAHQAATRLEQRGVRRRFSGPFFNEFALALDDPAGRQTIAERAGLLFGPALGESYPELAQSALISVTETNDSQQIERLCAALATREAP